MNTKLVTVDSFRDLMNFPMLSNLDDFFKEGNLWPSVRGFVVDPKM